MPGIQAQSDDGLVAEWHFDEGSGTITKDSSGYGKHGTLINTIWTAGKFDYGIQTSGGAYINVPAVDLANEWSITAWFLSPIPTNPWAVLTKGSKDCLVVRYGKDLGTFETTGVKFHDCGWDINTLTAGWHHIVAVGKLDGQTYFYIDGDYKCSSNYRTTTDVSYIGNNGVNEYPWGTIDEVRIYNLALTEEEVRGLYEGGQNTLLLTKTATPQSIKQGQTTTITLTVKNTGSTELRDIEIADTIPSSLTFIAGDTTKTYTSLSPQDSRQFQYEVQIDEAGTFNLEPAIASYSDDKGNYKTIKSKPESIEVIPSLITDSKQQLSKKSSGNVQSASVNLHGEKTDVALGEDVLLKLSAINIIGNPTMHVQVIVIPPSGWSVTSSEFAKTGAGQYSTTYELESGGGKDIEVRIVPNQIGDDFQVEGRIIYYFGDDVSTREDHTLSLPIKVRAESADGQKPSTDLEESKTPGFGVLVAVIGLLMTAHLIKRK